MMYMFGINIPAFRTLDVLSLEFEHFPNKYPNSYYNLMVNTNTEPLTYTNVPFSISPWKFTVYAKKIFLDRYSITGQIARDHYRPYNIFGRLLETEEVLKAKGDWWWALNLSISM